MNLHLRLKCWRFQSSARLVVLLFLNVPRRRFNSITIEISIVRRAHGFKNTIPFVLHIRENIKTYFLNHSQIAVKINHMPACICSTCDILKHNALIETVGDLLLLVDLGAWAAWQSYFDHKL